MEIMDFISWPYRVEIDKPSGEELVYTNYEGLQTLEYDAYGNSECVALTLIEFEDNQDISRIWVYMSEPKAFDSEECVTGKNSTPFIITITAMVSLYDEYAVEKMKAEDFTYTVYRNNIFFKRSIEDGRSYYRGHVIKTS